MYDIDGTYVIKKCILNIANIKLISGNGQIDFEELRTVLKSCMGESALHFSSDNLDDLTRALLEDADEDNSGSITFEELQTALSKHPGLVESLTIRLLHI